MIYAIISDIHGNLAALQQVIRRIGEVGCDRIVCLGDIVGYGPFPNECCEIIQEKADICIIGNHDHAAIGKTGVDYFNQYARSALGWTIEELTSTNKQFLQGLDVQVIENELFFVHAAPIEPLQWNYVLSLYDARDNFHAFDQKACFIGHSHVAAIFSYEDGEFPTVESGNPTTLFDGFRYIINVGSVGQPRDRNPDSCFALYDADSTVLKLERVAYDIKETQAAMRQKKLPAFLIERLPLGR
ncbi:metallophosphoesterase family protein [candidate division KSB1 bacterium]|nr:metallophosphoesterase family protein [candidate division KSB1 bacterium]